VRILLVQPTTYYPGKKALRSKTRWLLGSICRRLMMPPNGYFLQALPSNLYFHLVVNKKIDPVDFY
jgi:hypothetical protein